MRKHEPTPHKEHGKYKPSIIFSHWGNLAEIARFFISTSKASGRGCLSDMVNYFLQTRHTAGQSVIEATEEATDLWYYLNQHTIKPGK